MTIAKLPMPKWGLSMSEGKLVEWLVDEGAELTVGDDVAEVETEKINGIVEATAAGVLRRKVAAPGEVLPVGALLGVIADPSVADADIDAFVEQFRASFVPGEEEAAGPEPETADVAGSRIRFLRMGEGDEVLVLLHGFGGDLENWLFNQQPLAATRTVYALDLPGHGGSTKDVGAGDVEAFARLVGDFLDARGHERAHLVGHSLGGAVATALALARPERVASLTLIASAGLGPEVNGEFIEGFIAAQGRRDLKPYLELLFSDPGLVTRRLVENVLRYKRLDGVEDALRAVAAAAFPDGRQRALYAEPLAAASVPVLVIWGSADRIIPAEHARAAPPRSRVELLEVGHSPHMEAASAVNRIVDEFLGSLG